jgi:hypothetical protein
VTVGSIPTKGSIFLRIVDMNKNQKEEEQSKQSEFPFEDNSFERDYFQDLLSTEDCFPTDLEENE